MLLALQGCAALPLAVVGGGMLQAGAGAVVKTGTEYTIGGVRVLGVADPTYTASNLVSTGDANEVKLAHAQVVAAYARRANADILAVHDRRIATRSTGLVPLVLAGGLGGALKTGRTLEQWVARPILEKIVGPVCWILERQQ